MANIYVRSTDGNDADDGSTWALAKATIAGAMAIDVAGDTIWVSQNHSEAGGAINISCAGTQATPSRILCANDAAEPPTALATGATIDATGNISCFGSYYCYGLTFLCDAIIHLQAAGAVSSRNVYEQCSFQCTGGGSSSNIFTSSANNAIFSTELIDCTIKFDATGERVFVYGDCEIRGGSVLAGSVTPGQVFAFPEDRTAGRLVCSGFDFSNFASTLVLAGTSGLCAGTMTFRDCKLPAAWSGSLTNGSPTGMGQRFEMHNCDSGDTNYRLWVVDYSGTILEETTIVRTGGASDGTTALAWKMVTTANAEYPLVALRSPEVAVWNDSVGSSKTVTIEIITDNVTLKDDECWLEVMYLGTSGAPLGTWIDDAKADVLASAADQTSSSETWTTTGLTTPVKQKLSVTFTPQEKGFIHARVVLAKPSTTVYVDPKLTVS